MRLAKLAFGLLLGVLPGCVVIDARQSTVVHYSTDVRTNQTTTTTVEKDAPQRARVVVLPPIHKETLPKEKPVISTGCQPFVIPTRQALPVRPDLTPDGDKKLEEALAGYINNLRELIKTERKVLDEAHRNHLTGCKG